MHNLLVDPLIRVRVASGTSVTMSLPEVYEAAWTDDVTAFPALCAHQRHAWHAFLAQLGAVAVHWAGKSKPVHAAREWRTLFRDLTPEFDDDEPWRLIVDDPELPAFMQCPAGETLDEYRREVETPDDLDLLVTAKNHDVKQSIARSPAPDDWMFALIDLQTMAGFLGAGNYGIARMNGGFSARPCLGLAPADGGFGRHLFHDMHRMLAVREELRKRASPYYRSESGLALLWTKPWNGSTAIELADLDPYFIEICRRVRLEVQTGRIIARTAGSKRSRVVAKDARGNLGDFWTPVSVGDAKALSLSRAGFRYDRLAKLLFDRRAYKLPRSMAVGATKGKAWRVVARGLAGGQGKTDGYHERNDIVFSPQTTRAFGTLHENDRLAKLCKAQLDEVNHVASALRLGIAVAASGGKLIQELNKADRAHAGPFLRRFDREVDTRFFGALDRRFTVGDEETKTERAAFAREVIVAARKILKGAIRAVPCRAIHRYRSRARALSAFYGRLRGPQSAFSDQPEIFKAEESPNVE